MINDRLIKMIDPKGFDEVFNEETNGKETYKETFDRLNRDFSEAFDRKRYKNYEAYRQSRRQRIK